MYEQKISIKTLYLLTVIAVGLIALGVGSTYAMFTSRVEITNPITMNTTLNSDSDIIDTIDVELDQTDIKVAVINISNTSSSKLNYASFYISDSSNIEVGVTHNFSDGTSPTGSIETNTSKKIYIQLKNNSTTKATVTLGVLSSTGNIIKSENMTLVNDTNIDTEKPSLTITKNTSTSRTVTYTFTFSKKVSNFTADDITVSEGTKGTFTKISDTKYTLVVTHASDGAKTITVAENVCTDVSGNNNTAKSLTNTVDTVKPAVTITKNTSTSRTVTYTFTFSEAVTGFTASGVTVSEGTKGTFTKVSDTKYTLVVTHASDGSKTVTVAAGSAKDSAGNTNVAKTLTHTINTDTTKPTVTAKLSQFYGSKKYTNYVTFTWSEDVYNFDVSKITIHYCMTITNGTCGVENTSKNYASTLTQVDQKTYTTSEFYSSSSASGGGFKITVAASAAQDAAGNKNDAYSVVLSRGMH